MKLFGIVVTVLGVLSLVSSCVVAVLAIGAPLGIFWEPVVGGLASSVVIFGLGVQILRVAEQRKLIAQASLFETTKILVDPTNRHLYRLAMLRQRELGEPLMSARNRIVEMMLTDDLGDHRIGKNLLREFFPEAMDGLHYNWIIPSKSAKEKLRSLLSDDRSETAI